MFSANTSCTHVLLTQHLTDVCPLKTHLAKLALEGHLADLYPWQDILQTFAL